MANTTNKLYKYKEHEYPDRLLPYARTRRWYPPQNLLEMEAEKILGNRDGGLVLLDRKQAWLQKRRSALESHIEGDIVQAKNTVMLNHGGCRYKTFAKRWIEVGVHDEIICPRRDKKSPSRQHLLNGNIMRQKFASLNDTQKLRTFQARNFSRFVLVEAEQAVKEAFTPIPESPYLHYASKLDREISRVLNDDIVSDCFLTKAEKKRSGVFASVFCNGKQINKPANRLPRKRNKRKKKIDPE